MSHFFATKIQQVNEKCFQVYQTKLQVTSNTSKLEKFSHL